MRSLRPSFTIMAFLATSALTWSDGIPLDNIKLRLNGGAGFYAYSSIMFRDLYVEPAQGIALKASPWIQVDTEGNYALDYSFPLKESPALDLRDVYVEFMSNDVTLRTGREVLTPGVNQIVNPIDFSPLNYNDPFHPDRMGVYGASLKAGPFSLHGFLSQMPLFQESGPFQVLPDHATINEINYDQDAISRPDL